MSALELKRDQDELKRLTQLSFRASVKSILQGDVDRLQKSIDEAEEQCSNSTEPSIDEEPTATTTSKQVRLPLKKITSYAWDQSDLFVKVYASNLPGIQKIPSENVNCKFHSCGFHLMVGDLDGKDYQLQIVSLYGKIVPEESKIKMKSDSVLVMLKKASKGKWEGVTEIDRKKKEKQKAESAPKNDDDPQAGIMNMMKKMYDDGDDDMKRTIAKAWSESQDKKGAGLGGM